MQNVPMKAAIFLGGRTIGPWFSVVQKHPMSGWLLVPAALHGWVLVMRRTAIG